MYEREKGTIINISSIAGRKTFPDHSVYCATKFAVHAFSEALREEASQHNVRVVIVAPGVVETEVRVHILTDVTRSVAQRHFLCSCWDILRTVRLSTDIQTGRVHLKFWSPSISPAASSLRLKCPSMCA
jgi:NADP-dependent 3-hydroxy acid dehydrogenase YdfG